MKSEDPLLAAWDETLARKGDMPAILNTAGQVLRTFRGIEENARDVEATMARALDAQGHSPKPHNVSATQMGNHQDWPSSFLVCLRRRNIFLPIDESLPKEQSDAAFSLAARGGITDWRDKPPSLFKLTSGTTATPRLVRFRSEQLLADCNQICQTMGILDGDLNFGVIPISHSYGFSNLLLPLIARGVPMVVSCDRTPRAVLV